MRIFLYKTGSCNVAINMMWLNGQSKCDSYLLCYWLLYGDIKWIKITHYSYYRSYCS